MSAAGIGNDECAGGTPTGSALLGMLLALALIVTGVVVSDGSMLAVDAALTHVMEPATEQAPSDPTVTDVADVAVPSYMEEGLFADRDLEIALIVLVSPVALLALAARPLKRRGPARTVKGDWIGAIGGMTVPGVLVAVIFYGFAFMTIG